jgi:hypothetical protein
MTIDNDNPTITVDESAFSKATKCSMINKYYMYVDKTATEIAKESICFDVKIDDANIDADSFYAVIGTLTKDGCTIIVRDIGEEKSVYGEEYRIDKLVDGKWEHLKIILEEDYGWELIGYLTDENGREMKVNWKWLYGSLDKGHYRIVKSISLSPYVYEYFSVEFDIK